MGVKSFIFNSFLWLLKTFVPLRIKPRRTWTSNNNNPLGKSWGKNISKFEIFIWFMFMFFFYTAILKTGHGIWLTSSKKSRNKEQCKSKLWPSKHVQSTLVISNSKGLSEILRDIRTSTYQICRIEEKIIRTTTFNKYICNWTLEEQ